MARKIKIGDYVTTPRFDVEVEVTGCDGGTGDLIVRHVLDNGRDAYCTVSASTAALFVDRF